MPIIYKNGNIYGGASSADDVSYDNTDSDLTATNVQDAIDEVVSEKADRVPGPSEYDPTTTYYYGDICTHNGNVYYCHYGSVTGDWDANKWNLLTTPQQDYLHSVDAVGVGSFSLNLKVGTTVGKCSFAEGLETTASGAVSHAEGLGTTASGYFSHAEGGTAVASGAGSHAEGCDTSAAGSYSHAEGFRTTANHKAQHVFGEYNVLDTSTESSASRGNYIEIVGNGTGTSARSNARTLDWSGNEVLAGGLKLNGTEDVITTSKPAYSSGTDLSLVTTGEKYIWNNKADVPQIFNRYDVLLNADGGTVRGFGAAMITLQNGIARIDFNLKITVVETVMNLFTWGINRDYLTALTGKTISPQAGGSCVYYDSNNVIYEARTDLGGTFSVRGQFWQPARVYDDNGTYKVGGWASSAFQQNSRIVGTCYGTYT